MFLFTVWFFPSPQVQQPNLQAMGLALLNRKRFSCFSSCRRGKNIQKGTSVIATFTAEVFFSQCVNSAVKMDLNTNLKADKRAYF